MAEFVTPRKFSQLQDSGQAPESRQPAGGKTLGNIANRLRQPLGSLLIMFLVVANVKLKLKRVAGLPFGVCEDIGWKACLAQSDTPEWLTI